MGIQGLLQFIKEASEPINVRKYKGQAVAVDTYCWLHKGAIACADKLAKGEPTDRYVGFCMKFVNMLLSHGVKPILVFDGCTLPSKKEVERSRRERRQSNLLKGKQLLREGKVSEARECFTRSINITHAMAHKVIKAARAQGVDCLVAPYEADAQLAYLNKADIVQAVITEDSDLLAFGCKKVILKMDQFGNGLEIDQARLGMCRQLGDVFTEEKFRYMCILSGCDYLSSLRGIGLAKACKVLRLANNPDIVKVIKKIGHYLKMNITVPEDYIKGFIRANNTFLYQLVFDPIKRKLVPLNAYEDDIDPQTLSYAGQYVDDSVALQIALGNRDINTFEQIDDYNPDTAMPSLLRSHSWNDNVGQMSPAADSIWHRDNRPRLEITSISRATRLKENPSTVGIRQANRAKGLNLPRKTSVVKRQRGEELSEDELLSQYSVSLTKKIKKTGCADNRSPSSSARSAPSLGEGTAHRTDSHTPAPTRNKFATFLQRKNEQSGAVVVPGTRSRFFCSSADFDNCISEQASSKPPGETAVPDKASSNGELPYIDTESQKQASSEPPGETAVPDKASSLGELPCTDTESQKQASSEPPGETAVPDKPSSSGQPPYTETESQKLDNTSAMHSPSERISDGMTMSAVDKSQYFKTSKFTTISPPALGTLRSCFSWSGNLGTFSRTPSSSPSTALQQIRRKSDPPISLLESCAVTDTCQSKSDTPGEELQPSHEVGWPWSRGSVESPHSVTAPTHSQPSSKDSDSEVPGLYKHSSMDSLSTTKIKPLVPARVSGLSKKPASLQKRKHHDAENKPGLQIKISDLWKNFGFKKDSEKLASCKKPLSPVKDNIQLTPEAEEEIFNKPECVRAQRAIFH